jgi:hypothetical protein
MDLKTESVSIQHRFDDKDLAGLAHDQARAHGRKSTLELDLKAASGDFKARIAAAAAEISSIAARINSGFEMRSVDCLLADHGHEEGYRLVIRLDNGHITRRRKLAPKESQLEFSAGQTTYPDATDPLRQYCAAALLPVDDKDWDLGTATAVLVRLYEEEFEALRKLPDVRMTD